MKRYICIILLVALFISAFSLPVAAENEPTEEISASGSTESPEEIGQKDEIAQNGVVDIASYNCTYDTEAKRIKLSGTLQSEVFADRSGSTIAVYAVPPGASEYDVVADDSSKCLAEAPVSIKFEFSFRVSRIIDRYSRYAIFLRSPDGEYTLTTEAQYPEVASDFEASNNKKFYKGLASEYSSVSTDIQAGSAIIPLYWDSIFSDRSSSNLFMGVDGEQFFFNKATIDKLDIAVRSMSLSGTKIYLRLLKRPQGDAELSGKFGAQYMMPDVYDADTVTRIHAAITFLTERYSGEEGSISGFIIGKGWDDPEKYNYIPVNSFEEYVDRCAAYTVIVANAARTVDSSMEVAIPLTGEGFAKKSEEGKDNIFRMTVEALLEYFDNSIQGGIDCSLLMDTSETPLGITNDNLKEGINLNYSNPEGLFCAGAQKEFSSYLSDIDEEYRSCPKKYIFVWSPADSLSGNALAAAYVYSYYTLLADSTVSFFAIDLTESRSALVDDLAYIMKYIDTSEGLAVNQNLTAFFGRSSWSEIVSASVIAAYGVRHIYDSPATVNAGKSFAGSFTYFDFLNSNLIERWYRGEGCTDLKIDYRADSEKSLRANFTLDGTYRSSDILYVYSYPENMIYTPYMRLRFHVSDSSEDSLYEVRFVFGNGDSRAEASAIVKGNEKTEVVIDISQYVVKYMTESIRISVRSLDGESRECSLWIYDICGCSNDYTSDQLDNLISLERDKIRHPEEESEGRELFGRVAVALAIVIVTGAIGFGLFASFRREDRSSENDGDDDQDS